MESLQNSGGISLLDEIIMFRRKIEIYSPEELELEKLLELEQLRTSFEDFFFNLLR